MARWMKILVAVGLLALALSSIRIVKAGGRTQIVSVETVKVDSTLQQLRMVSPDEIQRLEENRATEISGLEQEIQLLKIRVARLEEQVNK
jgi:sensor histidine kinase YesM